MKIVYEKRGDSLATYAERIKELRDAVGLLLTLYRMLSPEMKKMIQAVVNNACLIDRDRGELKM